jgi:hypothetical protein
VPPQVVYEGWGLALAEVCEVPLSALPVHRAGDRRRLSIEQRDESRRPAERFRQGRDFPVGAALSSASTRAARGETSSRSSSPHALPPPARHARERPSPPY